MIWIQKAGIELRFILLNNFETAISLRIVKVVTYSLNVLCEKVLISFAKSLSDVCGGIGVSSFLYSNRFIILNKDLALFAFFFTRSELYFILNAFSKGLTLFFCLLNAFSSTSSWFFLHLLSSLRLFCFSSLMSSDGHGVGFLRVNTCLSCKII